MPPKARITREVILDAAFELVRTRGAEALTARDLAKRLGCSTQPFLYHFGSMENLRRAVYARADAFHSDCLMEESAENPLLALGLNYVRFAAREKMLFRFLFQSGQFSGKSLTELIDAPQAEALIAPFAAAAELSPDKAREVFRLTFLLAHGYAAMAANNDMALDEEALSRDLETAYRGAVAAIKGEE